MASRLSQMQARFQQKQMQEKEEKLLRLYENQQQRTIERVNRGSAGSNTSISSVTSVTSTQGGKVRQMFDERRQKAGIDRSYPLEPLRAVNNKTVVNKTTVHVKNGKPLVNKREVVQTYYNNNNGDEYFEEQRFEDDNANAPSNYGRILNKTYRPRDLELLMKNHHIQDNLDDEEFPDLGIDDIDEPVTEPTKVITKPPHQNGAVKYPKEHKTAVINGTKSPVKSSISPKKEPKATVRKTVVRAVSPLHTSPSSKSSINRNVSNIASPTRTPEKHSPNKMSTSSKQILKKPVERAPSPTRPSKGLPKPIPSMASRDNLEECKYCGRRFASDRIAKHEDVCAKTGKKKRKTYDATKHRIQGTELEPYVRKISKTSSSKMESAVNVLPKHQILKESKPPTPARKSDWRRKHEEFISAIRAAKMAQAHVAGGGKLSDLPPPPPSYNPDYVQCPHCGRRFNEAAAARHIPKCATYEFNKPKIQPRPGVSKGGFK